MTKEQARREFAAAINLDESFIELDRAALLIAAEEYPRLDIEEYLSRLDHFAEKAAWGMPEEADAFGRLLALSQYLFRDCGFSGDTENYYDARHSFLNDVIERRRGIPITLSVLLMEVARRLGLVVFGVGLPGHFVVKFFDTADEEVREVFLDPFNGGRVLTEEDCRRKVEEMYGGAVVFSRSFLAVVSKRQILSRMLQNLKGVYNRAAHHHKTLGVIERLLLLNPGSPTEIRDRGLVYSALERYAQARADLEDYLTASPRAEDAARIKDVLTRLRQRQAQLN